MPREALLARTLVDLADNLVDDFDVEDLLTRLADRCVDVLDVGAAGLLLMAPPSGLPVMAWSSEVAQRTECLIQVEPFVLGDQAPRLFDD